MKECCQWRQVIIEGADVMEVDCMFMPNIGNHIQVIRCHLPSARGEQERDGQLPTEGLGESPHDKRIQTCHCDKLCILYSCG